MDDIFLMFQCKDHVKNFLCYMNSRHPNIQFTYEDELNNNISFLDISITRENNKLITSLYRKNTFSGVYMNYNSFLPTKYKNGLLHTLLFRAHNICSSYITLHKEIELLKLVWQKKRISTLFH